MRPERHPARSDGTRSVRCDVLAQSELVGHLVRDSTLAHVEPVGHSSRECAPRRWRANPADLDQVDAERNAVATIKLTMKLSPRTVQRLISDEQLLAVPHGILPLRATATQPKSISQ